jgi:hypothetical protein
MAIHAVLYCWCVLTGSDPMMSVTQRPSPTRCLFYPRGRFGRAVAISTRGRLYPRTHMALKLRPASTRRGFSLWKSLFHAVAGCARPSRLCDGLVCVQSLLNLRPQNCAPDSIN